MRLVDSTNHKKNPKKREKRINFCNHPAYNKKKNVPMVKLEFSKSGKVLALLLPAVLFTLMLTALTIGLTVMRVREKEGIIILFLLLAFGFLENRNGKK